jgi:membrane dipeptidase
LESAVPGIAISERAAQLHIEALVWDNTLPFVPACGSHAAHVRTLGRMVAAGYDCVNLTVSSDNENMAQTISKLAHDRRYFLQHPDCYVLVDKADDVLRAKREGKLAVVFNFQGTLPFERDVGLVELYYRLGVRQALMAYNQRNLVADGCHERTDAGLSRFGMELVQAMNRVGMLVDCTHTGYRSSMDVFEVAQGPVVFSHSNARALWDHERNIRDDQAQACARTGGVIGVVGAGVFMGDNDIRTDTLFRHIDHFVNLIGPEHVGIGLDCVSDVDTLFALVESRPEKYPANLQYDQRPKFAEPEQVPELTELMLRNNYSDAVVRGILGENWLRVARAVWT